MDDWASTEGGLLPWVWEMVEGWMVHRERHPLAPQGGRHRCVERGGGVRRALWFGLLSTATTPTHNTSHHCTMLSQPQGHPGPNQQDTEHLQGQQSQAPAAWWLPLPLLSLSVLSANTHMHTHFLSCFLHPCPRVIIDSFSFTAPNPFSACHSLPQGTGDYSMPYPPKLQQHNFTQHNSKDEDSDKE